VKGITNAAIKSYLLNFFNETLSPLRIEAADKLWDFISDRAKKRFGISIDKEILPKLHLNALVMSVAAKINL
jgi:hypothetical protein